MVQDPRPGGGRLTAEEVEAALARILARPEYAPAEPPLLYQWLGRVFRWVGDRLAPLLGRIMPDLDFTTPGWERFGLALLGVGGLIGLALLAYLVYLAVRALRRRRRAAVALRRPGAPGPTTAAEWEALARRAAGREEWRAAAMALYQAVLLRLAAAGAVTVDRGKTPGDYRRDLRSAGGELAGRFETFLHGFERLAYGAGTPGADQYGRLTRDADSVTAGHD